MFRTVNKVKCLNERRCYVLADVIIFLYEVPRIFWHYINVDEVSRITLKKLLQSEMEFLQIATAQFITKFDGLLLQIATAFLLQSATRSITNCYRYYKVQWIYYKLRQVLQYQLIRIDILPKTVVGCPCSVATCNFQIELNATEPNPPIDRLFSLANYFQMQLDIRMLMFGDFIIFIQNENPC